MAANLCRTSPINLKSIGYMGIKAYVPFFALLDRGYRSISRTHVIKRPKRKRQT